ncbi:hypothetical protein PFBG_06022 [Plasmodium falciparum 7G8]|uniref:Uncharacterized protein n=3 Tax=Plasmodium falciparum TaxID=5833 RepID=A0A024X0X6_PLAFC|nr:hypothetical protein PFMALIP_06088 [Plasmodium falciparum MaliPS096_E11]ETW59164.1 hypothetical protein PFMC_04956 [Plasmodium falciparum CAMP/Malaysia]EUR55605.1 hypothetical protein PFBG_06022 [Plasmodium falciparum 7G8]
MMNHINNIIIHLFTFKNIVLVSLIYYVYIKITNNFINKHMCLLILVFIILQQNIFSNNL